MTGVGRAHTDRLNRIHKLLLELLPGDAKKYLSATQARELLNTIRPRDLVGRTRRRLASELISELVHGAVPGVDVEVVKRSDAKPAPTCASSRPSSSPRWPPSTPS